MSVLKKIMIGLFTIILIVMGFISYSRYQSAQELKTAFKNDDKIQVFYHLMASERYAKVIRQAGFTIPPDSAIRFDGAIDPLEIEGDLHLKIHPPGEADEELSISFSVEKNDATIEAFFVMDRQLNLLHSYYQIMEQNERKNLTLHESEEKRLLSIVQKEINGFLDTMEETLYNQ
ncbi:TPA: thiol-disulfide isomerase [Streptococcus suis]